MKNAVFENILTLDNNAIAHVRNVYSFMELLGDIAGIWELVKSIFGILFFNISKISFYLSAMKNLFLVKYTKKNIFEKKL